MHTRRSFVGLFAGALAGGAATRAFGQSLNDVLKSGGGEWRDGFDTASGVSAADVRTTTPILSPVIVDKLQVAIAQYTDIVAAGGWPSVPSGKALRLGVRDPAVSALRDRLSVSSDLS